jgi:hypothetical protein
VNPKTEVADVIMAALSVLFGGMWNPPASVVISIIALLRLGFHTFTQKTTR